MVSVKCTFRGQWWDNTLMVSVKCTSGVQWWGNKLIIGSWKVFICGSIEVKFNYSLSTIICLIDLWFMFWCVLPNIYYKKICIIAVQDSFFL